MKHEQTKLSKFANKHVMHICIDIVAGNAGEKESIVSYEVGAGTSRTDPLMLYNIHPLINVGLAKMWTFAGLGLDISSVYYIAVRATSESGVVTQAISNGVNVVESTTVTPGSVAVARLVPLI